MAGVRPENYPEITDENLITLVQAITLTVDHNPRSHMPS